MEGFGGIETVQEELEGDEQQGGALGGGHWAGFCDRTRAGAGTSRMGWRGVVGMRVWSRGGWSSLPPPV